MRKRVNRSDEPRVSLYDNVTKRMISEPEAGRLPGKVHTL